MVEFNLKSKVITYVKDEGTNLIPSQLYSLLLCHVSLYSYFSCLLTFALVMLCQRQYAMNEVKVGVSMKEVNLKDA